MNIKQALIAKITEEKMSGNFPLAELLCRTLIEQDPYEDIIWLELAVILQAQEKAEEAREAMILSHSLSQVREEPQEIKHYFRVASLFFHQGNLDYSIQFWYRCFVLSPHYAEAWCNFGVIYLDHLRLEKALKYQLRAVYIQPNNRDLQTNLAHSLLANSYFDEGFSAWEWRTLSPPRDFDKPKWNGDTQKPARILVYSEQGYGDVIQFSRYIPDLVRTGHRIILEARSSILPLFRQFEGISDFVVWGEPLPDFDFHVPITSLAYFFNRGAPIGNPYLRATDEFSLKWKNKFKTFSKVKIGIVWNGNIKTVDKRRDIPSQFFKGLLDKEGYDFISLQRDALSHSLPFSYEAGDEITDFSDLAGLIDNLDRIISVDTATAHLAGAMGKKTMVLLHFCPDWRWLPGPNKTLWYSSCQLYRQTKPDDWGSVIQSVIDDLAPHHFSS
jgi:hypothetical protein